LKRTFSYLFLLIFIFNTVGYFPVFLYLQCQVKHDIKQRIKQSIPQEELTIFTLTEAQYKNLDWVEDHEFRLNGDMYDVVRKNTDDKGSIVMYVINDKKEKEVFTNLEQQIEDNLENTTTGKNVKKVLKHFTGIYLPFKKLICFVPEKEIQFPLSFQYSSITFIKEIPSPPPQLA